MVAIRGSHLINPDHFTIEDWCESVFLDINVSQEVVDTWYYLFHKLEHQEAKQRQQLLMNGIEMVDILQNLNMDQDSLIAALLFTTFHANLLSREEILEDFGKTIIKLIDGVREMDSIHHLNMGHNASQVQVDNIRRMLLAMVSDFRCMIIKLAERITFLRDPSASIPFGEKINAAKECSKIYAPLANRLGIGQLKWELEDYCFSYLHSEAYQQIAKLLHERRIEREKYIDDFVTELRKKLLRSLHHIEVYGRPKHIYSIWRKMQKKQLQFSELYDIRAVRIIVQNLEDCYTALSIVHTLFKHLPSEFDDYIANPKPNGYQSIHTVVLGKGEKPIEIQIRTQKMHDYAELGVAAHWKYKEGEQSGRTGYEEKITWLRKLLAWQDDISNSGNAMESMSSQIFNDRVYVFTPKGEVFDLPTGSTPLDFAYAIHSEVGHRCIGAKVEGRIVPFTYQLKMGDQLEIITQKNPNPSRDWVNPNLGFTHTPKARSKILAWFKKQDRDKHIPIGKDLIETELARLHVSLKQIEPYILPRYHLKNMEDLYANLGSGDIRLNHVMNFLQSKLVKTSPEEVDAEILRHVANKNTQTQSQKKHKTGKIVVEGVGNLMHHIARCCQPILGDDIIGYITQGRGVSIHRADCEQLARLQAQHKERCVEAVWGEDHPNEFTLTIRIIANDRNGLLRDITTVLANNKVSVAGVKSRIDSKNLQATIDMEITLSNVEMLSRILTRLTTIDDIIEAKRLAN